MRDVRPVSKPLTKQDNTETTQTYKHVVGEIQTHKNNVRLAETRKGQDCVPNVTISLGSKRWIFISMRNKALSQTLTESLLKTNPSTYTVLSKNDELQF